MNKQYEIFCGRLGRDPELKYTPKGIAVCYLSVAINNDAGKPTWKKVVVWERQAEICSVQLKKGSDVFVKGQGKKKKFTTKDGEIKQYEEVNAKLVGFSNV